MSESGWETLPAVREWWEALPDIREMSGVPPESLGGQPEGLGMVGTPSRMSLRGEGLFRMSGSCRESPRMSGRPSRLSSSDRETFPDVQEWSGDPTGCLGVVERLSRMSLIAQETLLDV